MKQERQNSSRRRFGLVALASLGLIGVLTYLALSLGTRAPDSRLVIGTRADVVTLPTVADLPPLDPIAVMVFDAARSAYDSDGPLRVGAMPIGAYLPQEGALAPGAPPTAMPTPFPYPTAEPLPLPYVPENLPPTRDPTLAVNGRTLFYDGSGECAPAGRPVGGVLTQRFHAYHGGIDLGVPIGTPVVATHSGQVTYAGWSDVGYGYLVIIRSGRFSTYYAHNTSFNVSQGQFVGKGSVIAWSGSTGNSTGPHVHYETRLDNVPQDPLTFESLGFGTC